VKGDGRETPCRHVEKYREERRERFLSGDELLRLGTILDEVEQSREMPPWAIGAIRLLMFTGARLSPDYLKCRLSSGTVSPSNGAS
jgi:hypothetical protein